MLSRLGIPEAAIWWTMLFSAVMLGLAMIVVPIIVSRLPADYFAHEHHVGARRSRRFRWIGWGIFVVKNLLGAGLLLAGILMLVLPGQGLLTMLIAAIMLDYPGKFRLERWVITRKGVLEAANWMRGKAGHPPLVLGDRLHRDAGND